MLSQSEILNRLALYRERYADEYGIEEIGIFGSYARGNPTEASDIDIYVRLKEANLLVLSRIRIDLEEMFGKRVDIVQLREKMNNYLKRHIEEDAISA